MKIAITLISFLGIILYFVSRYAVALNICGETNYSCRDSFDLIEKVSYFAFYTFIVSVLIYKMPEALFESWWRFARWSIPVILVIVLVINLQLHHTPGSWFNVDANLDRLYVSILYTLFVLGSVIQIYRGYRRR